LYSVTVSVERALGYLALASNAIGFVVPRIVSGGHCLLLAPPLVCRARARGRGA